MTDTAIPTQGVEADGDGRMYWRSLEQLGNRPEYEQFLHREFQENATELPADAVSRRRFVGLVAAAVALASTTACRKPERKILPFAKRPEDLIPGVPRHYASALSLGGYGTGVLVKNSDGRPTKVEGNELHPASLGSSSVAMQGEVLNLYDPARSRRARIDGVEVPNAELKTKFADFWKTAKARLGRGEKLRVLLAPTSSPTIESLVSQFSQSFPQAKIHYHQPIHRNAAVAGSQMVFGQALDPQWHFDRADVVVALDCDFLATEVGAVRAARDFAGRRRPTAGADKLNRLYAIETGYSVTGGQADHRFRVRASEIAEVMFALAAEVGVDGDLGQAVAAYKTTDRKWVAAIARDLVKSGAKSLVVVGAGQPAVIHALAHAINAKLGGNGQTVTYVKTPALLAAAATADASIHALADAMDKGSVDTLFILGANPVYDAPVDVDFQSRLAKVPHRVHLGLHCDETGMACNWHLPAAHEFEAWGDVRAFDGTVSIVQPMIAPLFGGLSSIELLAQLAGTEETEGYKLVRYFWDDNTKTKDFEGWWNRALHDGLVHGSAGKTETATLQPAALVAGVRAHTKAAPGAADNLELVFQPSKTLYDGRYSNNAWLQECPDPITKLTWDNAAVISRATARALGVRKNDVISLTVGQRSLNIPVWIVPGTADFSVILALGYGRRLSDVHEVAKGVGADTYTLRTTEAGFLTGARASRTSLVHELASTQDHGAMEGRALYRSTDVKGYQQHPRFAPDMSPIAKAAALENKHHREHPGAHPHPEKTENDLLKSLWDERDYSQGYQWGMVIDLNTCNGCNACVVACQAENNIPVVGRDQVARGREMHWIRIDRYFTTADPANSKGDNVVDGLPADEDPGMAHQPVPCMHCENAPCESVCPVVATVHSPEGLNDMVYNRCIGTRYCSNNCPYKVRRFNFFDFIGNLDPMLQMAQNPDVTIRNRGVMEKCTYCVQRINGAKITARKQGRKVLDGEITPACGQACPSQAITFGNIVDTASKVHQLRNHDLGYAMLSELNVKPRTTYLAKVRNPNPELS